MDAVSWEGAQLLCCTALSPPSPGGITRAERSWKDGEEWLCRNRCPRHWLRPEADGGRAGGPWVLLEEYAVRIDMLLCCAVEEMPESTLSLSPGDCGQEA